jgi:thiol:disulfide interchange protein
MLNGPNYDTLGPEINAERGRLRRRALLAAVIIGAIVFVGTHLLRSRGPDRAGAATAFDPAAGEASKLRPTLMLFTADWCPPCQTLKAQVLNRPEVAARLKSRLVFMKVDLTTRDRAAADAATRHGVDGIPTMILFDRRGQEIDRFVGGSDDPAAFLRWLDDNGA